MIDLSGIVESIHNSTDGAGAFRQFRAALTEYGYDNAIYSLMNDHHSIGLKALHGFATDYPEDWLKHYNEHSYADVDPVFYGFKKSTPFYWQDAIDRQRCDPSIDKKTLQLAGDVLIQGRDAGIADGIGVSFTNPLGERAGFGISRTQSGGGKDMRVLAELYLICASFHETYMSFLSKQKVPHLTERERDVLSWSAEGKSDKEISETLSITVHTVRFHWNNIFRKLQARSKVQATMVAVKRGIVKPNSIGSIC